jgi:hypothetical protein
MRSPLARLVESVAWGGALVLLAIAVAASLRTYHAYVMKQVPVCVQSTVVGNPFSEQRWTRDSMR